jgi:hypothetical protein
MVRQSSDRKASRPLTGSVHSNENGAALIIGLMFLAILALMGSTAVVLTSTDLQIGDNHKTSVQAFNAAQAGIEEARNRLKGSKTAANYAGDPAASTDEWWSAYIVSSTSFPPSKDPDYDSSYNNYIPIASDHTSTSVSANSLQPDLTYLVKIRHKREYDAEQAGHTVGAPHYYDGDGNTSTNSQASPGNIVYYGYGDPANPTTLCQFTGAPAAGSTPVEIITAFGMAGGGSKTVEIEAIRPPPPPVNSALYGKDTITINGSSGYISGADNCGVAGNLSPVYVLNTNPPPSGPSNVVENPAPTYNPPTPGYVDGPDDIDISGYVDSMKDSATIIITSDQNGGTYGDSDNFVCCYSDTSNPYNNQGLKLSNVTGYGMLLVDGDLTLGGGFTWNGLVLVTGTLTFNGGGSGVNIYGAVMANQTVDVNGGLDIRYDSCMISNAVNNQALSIITWSDKLT